MSYDFIPTAPPFQTNPDAQALADWAHEMLDWISRNLTDQRPGWNDLKVPVTATRAGGAKDPDFTQVTDDGAGSQGVYAYAFSPTTEEELFFVVQLPHGRVKQSDLRPHVHWMPSDASAGVVRWGLEYTVANAFDPFGTTTILYADGSTQSQANHHLISGFDPDLDGSQIRDSAMILCRVFRDAGHANDTYTADAFLLEVDFHCLLGALGSDEEYPQ